MNTVIQFFGRLALGGEILTEPATFLPGEQTETTTPMGNFMSELKHLPVFHRFPRFTMVNNAMAQPLLNGGCNEMR